MAFSQEHFARYRMWLYHFTTPENAGMLRNYGEMRSAAEWVSCANSFRHQISSPLDFLGRARLVRYTLCVRPEATVTLNDQLPLQHESSFYELQGTYADYIRCLNGFVFFWPGQEAGPTPKGDLAASFGKKYAAFGCIRLRVDDVWSSDLRFCKFNSGAPQARDRVTRGPHIFVPCTDAGMMTKDVAEVVFPRRLVLPRTAQWKAPNSNEWLPLFD